MNKINIEAVWIQDETRIVDLAKSIHTYRSANPEYWEYLLEPYPSDYLPIVQDLIVSLEKDKTHHRMYMICVWAQKDLWYILMKNYADKVVDDPVWAKTSLPEYCPTIETSYRTMRHWVCWTALRMVLVDLLNSSSHKHIKTVLWHHAAENIASWMVFHWNWYAWLRYHEKYVTLPNLRWGEVADTIMWRLDANIFHQDCKVYPDHAWLKSCLKTLPIRIQSPNWCGPKIQSWRDNALNSWLKKS